jgi:hypothetical protein
MASELDHINLANRNHDALRVLAQADPPHPEWMATIAFYKALQIIEGCFANLGLGHGCGHQKRLEVMSHDRRFDHVFRHYKALLEASEIARYLSSSGTGATIYRCFDDYMDSANVKDRLLGERLKNVEMHSRSLLSDAAKASLISIERLLP